MLNDNEIPNGASGDFKEYLQSKGYKERTIEGYLHYRDAFLKWMEEENLTIESCQYADLLKLVKALKEAPGKRKGEAKSRSNINSYIRGVKYYYDYLQKEEKVQHNPAEKLQLKGRTLDLPADLLTMKEMEQLYQEHPSETQLQKRNKTILGLVVYQALQEREIANLEAPDINLEKGTIKIHPSGRSNGRTLKLQASQILLLQEFVKELLPKMKKQNIKSITWLLAAYLKKRYPKFKNLLHLRTSVIAHWTEKKNLREVQYMAGHKTLISTEVYKQVNLKDLKKALDQFHPLR